MRSARRLGRSGRERVIRLLRSAETDTTQRRRRVGQAYVTLAAVTWSTAGVLQHGLRVSVATQVAGRATFATVTLFAFTVMQQRGGSAILRRPDRSELAMATCMATASGTFIVALNYASVANVLILQAAAPIAAAGIAWRTLGEPISRRAVGAMLLALCGIALIAGAPGGLGAVGVSLSVLMSLAFALSVVIARHRRDVSMAPAMCLSQVFVLLVSAPFCHPGSVDALDGLRLAVLGVVQVGLGLCFLTVGARRIPATEVAVISLLEVILGPVWVWLWWSQEPAVPTLIGGATVIAAAILLAAERGSESAESNPRALAGVKATSPPVGAAAGDVSAHLTGTGCD